MRFNSSTGAGIPKSIHSRGTYFPKNTYGYSASSYYFFPEFTQIAWVKIIELGTIKIGFFTDDITDSLYGMTVNSASVYGSIRNTWKIFVNKITISELSK